LLQVLTIHRTHHILYSPYTVLTIHWTGCSRHYEYPAKQFNADYGEPLGQATETAKDSGVFVREWSRVTVQMDCNTYTPKITFK
jgi:hypothetical protein